MQENEREDEQRAVIAVPVFPQIHPQVDHGGEEHGGEQAGAHARAEFQECRVGVHVAHQQSQTAEEHREDKAAHIRAAAEGFHPLTGVLLAAFPPAGVAFALEFLTFEKVPHEDGPGGGWLQPPAAESLRRTRHTPSDGKKPIGPSMECNR